MLKYLLLLGAIFCSTVFGQTYQWVNIVSPNYQFNPASLQVPSTIDNSGNPICARLLNYQQSYNSIVYGDVKLEKRYTSGSLLWEDTIYGKAAISELTIDTENNVICIGTFRDSVVIGTTTLFQTWVNQNSFIIKTDDSGNFLWAKDGASFAPQNSVITALDLKASNNILVGATNYGVNANIYEFNSDGNLVSTILQPGVETISDINVDNSGNIWATGFAFNGALSFNGLDTIAPFSYNEYVVKYNSSGIAQWVSFIEDITVQDFKIETDYAGNGYLSGNLFDSTSFGILHANGPQWVYDFFVTKIDPDGNYLWLQEIPPGNTLGDATIGNTNFLSCGNSGNTFITGFFRGQINFGNGVTLSQINGNSAFVLSYDFNGIVQWAKSFGGISYNEGSGIVTDNNGSCYVSGVVSQNAVFDTITIAGGSINLFLARLMYENPVNVSEDLSSNVSSPDNFYLAQNYPNPFNPSTKIRFTVPSNGRREMSNVTLKIYDVLGKEITTLVNEKLFTGEYEIKFSPESSIKNLASGIYFYQLQVLGPEINSQLGRAGQGIIQTKKMILIK